MELNLFMGLVLFLTGSRSIVTAKGNSGKYSSPNQPNVIILLADDLGYGDLSYSGHPTSRTPNIDLLATNGRFLTHFYVTTPICSPSRASLLTGRYPIRSGSYPGTYVPDSVLGLPRNETTIAKILKKQGYATQMVGKWHLGVGYKREFLPSNVEYGFDNYFGLPYSHDMCPCHICFSNNGSCFDQCWNDKVSCPLFKNGDIIEQPAYLPHLTSRYVDESLRFISSSHLANKPFFLYFAFQHIHHPQFASAKFENKNDRGLTGDALLELDWAVGEVVRTLTFWNIIDDTLIWFASDNGPSLLRQERGGCAGLLRCGKGTTWEGGVRVPGIIHWPKKIKPGRSNALVSSLDILPTICSLLGADISNLTLDGVDVSNVLFDSEEPSPREFYAIYPGEPTKERGPYAVIYKQYKAHFYTEGSYLSDSANYDRKCTPKHKLTKHDPPILYNLHNDPGERYDLSGKEEYKNLTVLITKWREIHMDKISWMKPRTNIVDDHAEPCCTSTTCSPFPLCCDCPNKSTWKSLLKNFILERIDDDKCSKNSHGQNKKSDDNIIR